MSNSENTQQAANRCKSGFFEARHILDAHFLCWLLCCACFQFAFWPDKISLSSEELASPCIFLSDLAALFIVDLRSLAEFDSDVFLLSV